MIGIDRVSLEALRSTGGGGAANAAAVAREFESHLLGEVMKLGSRPLVESTLLDGGSAGRMFRDYFYQEVVRKASQNSGFGIATQLEAEIVRVDGRGASGGDESL